MLNLEKARLDKSNKLREKAGLEAYQGEYRKVMCDVKAI